MRRSVRAAKGNICECGCGGATAFHFVRGHNVGLVPQRLTGPLGVIRAPMPSREPSLTEIAWAAGIYEGERTAAWNKTTTVAAVAQKDRWLRVRLQEMFGGSISGPASWHGSGELARRFLRVIYPYLSPRRQAQADRASRPAHRDGTTYYRVAAIQ